MLSANWRKVVFAIALLCALALRAFPEEGGDTLFVADEHGVVKWIITGKDVGYFENKKITVQSSYYIFLEAVVNNVDLAKLTGHKYTVKEIPDKEEELPERTERLVGDKGVAELKAAVIALYGRDERANDGMNDGERIVAVFEGREPRNGATWPGKIFLGDWWSPGPAYSHPKHFYVDNEDYKGLFKIFTHPSPADCAKQFIQMFFNDDEYPACMVWSKFGNDPTGDHGFDEYNKWKKDVLAKAAAAWSQYAEMYIRSVSILSSGSNLVCSVGFVYRDIKDGKVGLGTVFDALAVLPPVSRALRILSSEGKQICRITRDAQKAIAEANQEATLLAKAEKAFDLLSQVPDCDDETLGFILRLVFCLDEKTPVLTRDGQVEICKLKIGQEVWSWNECTEKQAWKPVVDIETNSVSQVRVLHLAKNAGTIICTDAHAFYCKREGAKEWLKASALKKGDLLYSAHGGWIPLEAAVVEGGSHRVVSITVADNFTFYAGSALILTHNQECLNKHLKRSTDIGTLLKTVNPDLMRVYLQDAESAKYVSAAFRRGGGKHEWIPCAWLRNVYEITDEQFRNALIDFMDKARSATDDMVFNAKGESGHPGNRWFKSEKWKNPFHEELEAAASSALEGTNNIADFKTEWRKQVEKVIVKYFKDDPDFKPMLTTYQNELNEMVK